MMEALEALAAWQQYGTLHAPLQGQYNDAGELVEVLLVVDSRTRWSVSPTGQLTQYRLMPHGWLPVSA